MYYLLKLCFHNFIVDEEEEATHVLYPPADPLEEEFARPVMRRSRQVMLHWYYLPDSHDSWVTMDLPVRYYLYLI